MPNVIMWRHIGNSKNVSDSNISHNIFLFPYKIIENNGVIIYKSNMQEMNHKGLFPNRAPNPLSSIRSSITLL